MTTYAEVKRVHVKANATKRRRGRLHIRAIFMIEIVYDIRFFMIMCYCTFIRWIRGVFIHAWRVDWCVCLGVGWGGGWGWGLTLYQGMSLASADRSISHMGLSGDHLCVWTFMESTCATIQVHFTLNTCPETHQEYTKSKVTKTNFPQIYTQIHQACA